MILSRWYLVGLLASAAALPACREEARASAEVPGSANLVTLTREKAAELGVAVGQVGERPLDDAVVTSGRVTFDDLHVAHIFSPVTGRVVRMTAGLGEHVKAGQPLASIQSPDLGQASSDLGKANADLIAAEHDFRRKSDLYSTHAVSAADYEASEDVYRQAKAEKSRAEQKARLLRAGSADLVTQGYTLTSPIDGEVIARTVNPGIEVQGQYSGGGGSNELFTIGDLGKVWVLADVYESDLARVAAGAKVSVTVVAYPNHPFQGVVDWVSGALDATTRTVRVRCTFDNADRLLKPEMYGTVRIGAPGRNQLAVARSAVVKMGDQNVVFVSAGGADHGAPQYERLPVSVDDTVLGDFIPVEHGLETGMTVVTAGAEALSRL